MNFAAPAAVRNQARAAMLAIRSDETVEVEPYSLTTTSMGGRFVVHVDPSGHAEEAARACRMAVSRVDRWASRLTRHSDTSDLMRLNADPAAAVPVRPILAAALAAGLSATEASEGFADITLLDARLRAEGISPAETTSRPGEWKLVRRRRGAAIVRRPPGLSFDLGGVGKGWIADRTLNLLARWRSAVVDADGDLAVQCAPGSHWDVAIEDPRYEGSNLAVLRLAATPRNGSTRWGVATSGTSIHRWNVDGAATHHLIDPRTRLPAATDVVQATVVAGSALRAEALAKAAVIAGSVQGFALLERAGVRGAVLLTTDGRTLALPVTLSLLAE